MDCMGARVRDSVEVLIKGRLEESCGPYVTPRRLSKR